MSAKSKIPSKLPTNTEIFDSFLAYIAVIFALVVSGIAIIAGAWQGLVARSLKWGYIDLAVSLILMCVGGWLSKFSTKQIN